MKVKQLIDKLSNYDQELEVSACYDGSSITTEKANIVGIASIYTNEDDELVLILE